ncbi:MAG: serine/threonine-protein phosphatase [Acidisphaera sp.]|nr:serine/threonine-protein phosphatase [Acidisphaera sp.]
MTQDAANSATGGRFRSAGATHAGAVRSYNQDHYVNRPDLGLWAVADGAGGHQDGHVAAGMIAEALEAIPPGLGAGEMLAQVRHRMTETHDRLRAEAAQRAGQATIASTVVVLLACDAHFACLWAGDSRAYLLRAGRFTQVTRDHSLVQELVEAGAITAEQAERHPHANVITRAIGADVELELDKVTDRLLPGDRFLLCSDGVSKTLPEAELAAVLADLSDEPRPDRLIAAALAREATDNVTTVAVEVTR